MPKLVCDVPDPNQNVEYYTLAGLPNDPRVEKDPVGAYGFQYELAGLPPGPYSMRVSACNTWSCSLPSPLDFTVPESPLPPTGLNISFDY
jgi:hypothetical protein